MSASKELQDNFADFVQRARLMLARPTSAAPADQFRAFVEAGRKTLLRSVFSQFRHIQRNLKWLCPWLLENDLDLFQTVGLSSAENAYTELVAWALNPDTNRAAALACQQSFLAACGVPGVEKRSAAASPRTQFVTRVGAIPDLVLKYDDLLVVVEAKTDTDEHPAPTGEMQTVAYPKAVRKTLHLDETFSTVMVYLTANRAKPANENAVATSYLQLAIAFAMALSGVPLREDVRSLYKLVITHLSTCAVFPRFDVRNLSQFVDTDEPHPSLLLAHLSDLTNFVHLVPEKEAT